VLGVGGISIPLEIDELARGFSLLKLLAFSINIAIFIYLLKKFPKSKPQKS
jgi:uncharacterized membrane protein (DUF2068 family)